MNRENLATIRFLVGVQIQDCESIRLVPYLMNCDFALELIPYAMKKARKKKLGRNFIL